MTTSAMAPLPAASACTCRICVPEPLTAAIAGDTDGACIDTVARYGWQVTVVGGEGACSCCDEPAGASAGSPPFAYTVGLTHRAGHPELAISGLRTEVMHHALNVVAQQVVRNGLRVHSGDVLETVLSNAPVTVDAVNDVGLQRIGAQSAWFHRRPVEALQLVWPTVSGVFAWQPGAPDELDEMQPVQWRNPSPRTGALAADPPWPFPVAPDTMVVVCTHLRRGNEPVRSVARTQAADGTEFWDFLCGRDHGQGIDHMQMEHVAHTVRAAPSLHEIADLGIGQYAERADAFTPWRRGSLWVAGH